MFDWLTGIFQSIGGAFESIGISAVNPWLALGALAVASPIIIHLLSKRKFKVVDWAAMDFLLDANRRNRRRVKLENLLLLLLRCLAVALIAALVARPFFKPHGLAAQAFKAASLERIVLLDDSPSMTARNGNKTLFDDAKGGLVQFVREMADGRSGDSLTLFVTSQPNRPLVHGQYMQQREAEEVVRLVESLKPSDLSAQFDKSLLAIEDALKSTSGNINRAVYVISDIRRRDWIPAEKTPKDRGVPGILRRISEKAAGCILVDMGNDTIENLAVTDITPLDKNLLAGVDAQFRVTVQNLGDQPADDVDVKLIPGDALEMTNRINHIKPGEAETTLFSANFRSPGSVPVRAEIRADNLAADNVRYFAARVQEGVRVLLVDGDRTSERGRSEVSLRKVLMSPGAVPTGNDVAPEVDDSRFNEIDVDGYQAIWMCNASSVSEERVSGLEQWVRQGGGLIVVLGDQIDDNAYNQLLFKDGKGLLPCKLESVAGDETHKTWVNFTGENENHPLIKAFYNGDEKIPFNQYSPIFRWWHCSVPAAELAAGRTTIVASFNDPDASPAIIDKQYGAGHVVVITTPLNGDWNAWPLEPPSYLTTMLELNRYVARKSAGEGNLTVGTPIHYEFDPSKFKRDARLRAPAVDAKTLQAVDLALPQRQSPVNSSLLEDESPSAGIYSLELTRIDGETQNVLFAANLDPSESDLHRVDDRELRVLLEGANVRIEHGRAALTLGAIGARSEFWKYVLTLLACVLCVEQGLAWWFGHRRQ